MKKVLKYLLGFLFVSILILATVAVLQWKSIRELPGIAAGFTAKEACTCMFVNQQTEDYCRSLVKQWIPIAEIQFDLQGHSTRAAGLGAVRTAHMIGDRFGCQLDP